MDATFRPHQLSREDFAYAENKKIFQIFQTMLERLAVDRPEKPMDFLYDMLMKYAVYDVLRVYILGPPSETRKLICAAIARKLDIVYLTEDSLKETDQRVGSDKSEDESTNNRSDFAKRLKQRVEMADCARNGWLVEGLPKTRGEAFALRKSGIFPTHIVVLDSSASQKENSENVDDQEGSMEQVTLILDLHCKSYWRKFQIEDSGADKCVQKVLEFLRRRQRPFSPFLPRVLLFGPHGSGKRTVAKELSRKFKLVIVDFETELRRAALSDSPLKDRFYDVMMTSDPVPLDLLVQVASERLLKEDCKAGGWIMYNFPDTVEQAKALVKDLEGFQVNRAIFLDASLQGCLDRVEPRRWDPSTGKTYHLQNSPCEEDSVRERLVRLPRDSSESVRSCHELYSKNSARLKSFFESEMLEDIVTEVDADQDQGTVFEIVQGALLRSAKVKIREGDGD